MSMFRHALMKSALHNTLSIPKQPHSPAPQDDTDSDYEMTASPVSSPNITTRSLSPSDMIIVSPSPSPSPASSPSITTRKLRVTLPTSSHHDDDDTLSPMDDLISTTNKDKDMIPLQYPGLGARYQVTSTIQESLFGSVHLATDMICNRQVAIKISKRTLSTTGTARSGNPVLENVLNEARIMRDLQSHTHMNTHIVPLLDEIEDQHYHYLITPYYNQGDLYTYLTTLPHTRMNEIQALSIFKQLCYAVGYMHSHGIAHRDLSLENIMLHQGKHGLEAYVIDLGVAAINPAGPGITTFPCPGAKLASEKPGKAMYISPELWSGQQWEAYSNDIFSLGVILYCMLVGRQPFNSSIDVWAQFITSGKWYKLLQHVADGKIKPESIDPNNYNYWVVAYQHMSRPVLDLISHMLCPIQKRYTLHQIMNHPWMKQQI